MSEVEYTEILFFDVIAEIGSYILLKSKTATEFCVPNSKARESLDFALWLPQTSPPKKPTSLPLRLGFACPSPGGSRPLTLAFCRGLEYVWDQNTHFTSKKGLLGPKTFSRTLFFSLLLLVGFKIQ